MKGKTHVTVKKERTIAHLDPHSKTHADDQAAAKAARAKEKQEKAEKSVAAPMKLKYPSLQGGVLCAPDGIEISSDEHTKLLKEISSTRSYYYGLRERAGKRATPRKRKTDPLHSLAVLMRPDHALALALLERDPTRRGLVRPLMLRACRLVSAEFAAATGLEPIACEIHPEEGCLHLHLTYSTVSADHRLLWSRGHRGRHGLRLLGPSHGGTLRLVAAGFLPPSEGELALHDFKGRCRELHGEVPIDWKLSLAVEGLVEAFSAKHGLGKPFADAAAKYRADLNARRAEKPEALKASKDKAENENARLRREVAELRDQLAQTRGDKIPLTHTPSPEGMWELSFPEIPLPTVQIHLPPR